MRGASAASRPKHSLASGAKAHNGDTEKVMLARAHTFTIEGLEARFVTVEVDIRVGLPSFTIVGSGRRRRARGARSCARRDPQFRI